MLVGSVSVRPEDAFVNLVAQFAEAVEGDIYKGTVVAPAVFLVSVVGCILDFLAESIEQRFGFASVFFHTVNERQVVLVQSFFR